MDKTTLTKMNLETAKRYGIEQFNQTMEECAELIKALNKYRRFDLKSGIPVAERHTRVKLIQEITEEIADIEICLEQIKYIMGISESKIDSWKECKILRTHSRVVRGDDDGLSGSDRSFTV